MGEFTIRVATARRDIAEIRQALDEAFGQAFPAGLIACEWSGARLQLTGPGASGSVELVDGHLVGRAKLEAPAALAEDTIQERVAAVLRHVAR